MITENTNSTFFEKYKKYRKSKNISIEDICQHTKINIKYINAIETGEFNIIPSAYRKLFIRTYAEYIQINISEYLSEYDNYLNAKYGKTLRDKTPEYITRKKGLKDTKQLEGNTLLSESYFINKKKILLILVSAILIISSLLFLKLYNLKTISSEWHKEVFYISEIISEETNIKTSYSHDIIFQIKYHNEKNELYINNRTYPLLKSNDIKEIRFNKNDLKEFKLNNGHAILMINNINIKLKNTSDMMIRGIYSPGKVTIKYYKNPSYNFFF